MLLLNILKITTSIEVWYAPISSNTSDILGILWSTLSYFEETLLLLLINQFLPLLLSPSYFSDFKLKEK